jgi:hypothetical protein
MQVRVWNDNVHAYQEKFKGELIQIPSKSFIVMDEDDAYNFKGTFAPPVLNTDGVHMPEGFKMIRVEHLPKEQLEAIPKTPEHQCMACKYKASGSEDLKEHEKTHESSRIVDEQAEREIQSRKKRGVA